MSHLGRASLLIAVLASNACIPDESIMQPGAPYVEFLRHPALRGSIDTSRMTRSPAGGIMVWLRFDYAEPQPHPGDSSRHFVRMEWNVNFRCSMNQLRDHGMLVFDSTGRATVKSPAAVEGWLEFDEHPVGLQVVQRACSRLESLSPPTKSASSSGEPIVPDSAS